MLHLTRWRSRRGLAVHGLAVAVLVATLGGTPPASAVPPTSAPAPAAAPDQAPTISTPTLSTTVTLITGHKVRYVEGSDGTGTATLLASPEAAAERSIRSYTDPTGVYVIPKAAEFLVTAGVLDRELFDVQYLARNGYGDDKAAATPVIVSYAPGVAARSATGNALPGATKRRDLHSITGAGLTVDKGRTAAFWTALAGKAGTAPQGPAARATSPLGSGVQRVWLDRKVTVNLAESVPLVGAPEAWNAGYDGSGVTVAVLDTGADVTHPDLQGKVVDSRSFVPGVDSIADGHGHGTHVAATVAGTGAGAGGTRKGVAPGADLMVGKVLADGGTGDTSWIIDGMEWAATNGADIVSLSLGSGPTDGTDPAAQAVNRLTAETGTLFVIAAGNEGGTATVASPGTADAALTVAATDKNDQLAYFSSRGPRVGDNGLKPDIAAPGVGIIAARAKGTSMPTPVDDLYTSANGTSMATPHVAGAAAVLAQQHPDWTPAQLKATLMSTSKDAGFTVYEQGAGRLDVARAVSQRVTTTTANVDFGTVVPEGPATLDRQVSYANPTDQPVTLTVAPTLRRSTGEDVSGALTASAATLSVPAGGTATMTVTLDPTALDEATYTGAVVATDAATGTRITVPVGAVKRPPSHRVSVRVVAPDGTIMVPLPQLCTLVELHSEEVTYLWLQPTTDNGLAGEAYVAAGDHNFQCQAVHWTAPGGINNYVEILEPQLAVTKDVSVDYDLARDAVPIHDLGTPQPAETVHISSLNNFTNAAGKSYSSFWVSLLSSYDMRPHAVPNRTKATIGAFRFGYEQVRSAPEAVTTVHGRGTAKVTPVYASDVDIVAKFRTDQRLPLATWDDLLAGRDVRGKLVLYPVEPYQGIGEQVTQAADAGAAGMLTYGVGERPNGYGSRPYLTQTRLPMLWLPPDQWSQVAKVLDGADRPYVDIRAQTTTPYEYKLRNYYEGQIPGKFPNRVRPDQLKRVQTAQHSQIPVVPYRANAYEVSHALWPNDGSSFNAAHYYEVPTARAEYYSVTGPDIRYSLQYEFADPQTGDFRMASLSRRFLDRKAESLTLNRGLSLLGQRHTAPDAGTGLGAYCMACRQDDTLHLAVSQVAGHDRDLEIISAATMTVTLERDGVAVTPKESPLPGVYVNWDVPSAAATYQLRTVYDDGFTGQRLAKHITTDWTFRSEKVAADDVAEPYVCIPKWLGLGTGPCGWQPLIQLSYDLDLALDDTTRAGKLYRFEVKPWHVVPNAPKITAVTTQVSYDDGRTWKPALVIPWFDGSWQVVVHHPKLERTSGAVAIRTEVRDSAGNRVVQQIDRAYGLTESHPLATP